MRCRIWIGEEIGRGEGGDRGDSLSSALTKVTYPQDLVDRLPKLYFIIF